MHELHNMENELIDLNLQFTREIAKHDFKKNLIQG